MISPKTITISNQKNPILLVPLRLPTICLTMASSWENGFASSYMLLKPEELSLFDLIAILFSSDLGKRKFVDCPEGTVEETFRYRWLIFISVLTQKSLQFVAKPLALLGYTIELSLNIISGNCNVFMLVLNFLRG